MMNKLLTSIAVADAYAIPWEFVKDPANHNLNNDLATYQTHPKYGPSGELVASQYTDDTLRSIATALVVINHYRNVEELFNPCVYIKSMQSVVSADRRKGWSRRFQAYMEANLITTPAEFMRGLTPKAKSNGAIMGCLPLGFLKNFEDIKLAATCQAISTHSVDTAIYAQMLALAAHYFLYGLGDTDTLPMFLKAHGCDTTEFQNNDVPAPWDMTAKVTALSALQLVIQNNSLTDILRAAVDIGGDTDSLAALAVGIASCSRYHAHDLPDVLLTKLDLGNGQEYLAPIDAVLSEII